MPISKNQAVSSLKYQSPRFLRVKKPVWSNRWMPKELQGTMPTIITTKERPNSTITIFWRRVKTESV